MCVKSVNKILLMQMPNVIIVEQGVIIVVNLTPNYKSGKEVLAMDVIKGKSYLVGPTQNMTFANGLLMKAIKM